MKLVIKDTQNMLTVPDNIFGVSFNKSLVHQVIVSYLSNARRGTCFKKNRANITGSKRKPWRQKGTGRARSGSVKSPIWRSGGVTFASNLKNYNQKINRKMYRGAIKSIFSELIRQDRLIVVESFVIEKPKTKLLIQKLKNMNLKNALIILENSDRNIFLSSRNLHKISIRHVDNINPVILINFENIVITSNAVNKIQESLI